MPKQKPYDYNTTAGGRCIREMATHILNNPNASPYIKKMASRVVSDLDAKGLKR